MTHEVELANLLWFILATALLLLVVYRALVPLFVAEFRHDLFALRRRLFLLMARGKIEPSNPAYCRLRETMNGLLFRAEYVTGYQMLAVAILTVWHRVSSRATQAVRRTEAEIRQVKDPDVRSELQSLHHEMNVAITRHLKRLFPVSPVLWMLITIGVGMKMKRGLAESKGWLAQMIECDGLKQRSYRATA